MPAVCAQSVFLTPGLLFTQSRRHPSSVHCFLSSGIADCDLNHGERKFPHFRYVISRFLTRWSFFFECVRAPTGKRHTDQRRIKTEKENLPEGRIGRAFWWS